MLLKPNFLMRHFRRGIVQVAWFSIPFQLFISMSNKLYREKKSTSVSIGVRGGEARAPPGGPNFLMWGPKFL